MLDITDELREKCPWDRKQTFETLRHLTIEETYELGDAILENNLDEINHYIFDINDKKSITSSTLTDIYEYDDKYYKFIKKNVKCDDNKKIISFA